MLKLWLMQSGSNHISLLLPLTDMLQCGRSEETTLRVTCNWPHVM